MKKQAILNVNGEKIEDIKFDYKKWKERNNE